MPRFGKDKDSARKEELDRQAAEEVERLTRRGGPPAGMGGRGGGMGGMPGMGPVGIPSPLERIAEELRDAPRPSMRRQAPPRKAAPKAQQAFTPMPSGSVGSSFGPGGLNPGPRMGGSAPPPPAFGGGAYDDDQGGLVTGPPVYNAGEPDENEEMSITELALMDHAAHTGHSPEDLVIRYDASSAEEMRDRAMRTFYERQQSRRPGTQTNNPFAPAGMRGGPAGSAPMARNDDPAAVGGALAQRVANRRRREEEEARRARAEAEPAPSRPGRQTQAPATAKRAAPAPAEGALAKVLARRRQALGIDEPAAAPPAAPSTATAAPAPPGRRHAEEREETSPGLRAVALGPVGDERAPSSDDVAEPASTPQPPPRSAAKKAKVARSTTKAKSGSTAGAPAAKAPARRAKKGGATLAAPEAGTAPGADKAPAARKSSAGKTSAKKAPAKKAAAKKVPARKAAASKAPPAAKSAAKTVFCIECGERNPAIAKFCFNCGTRLAAPEL